MRLKVRTGPSKNQSRTTGKNVIAPSVGHLVQSPGSNLRHTIGLCGVGFKGAAYIEGNVSWRYIQFSEGTDIGVGTGFYSYHNGDPHNQGDWLTVGGDGRCGIISAGVMSCKINTTDTVDTRDDPAPFSDGTFYWNIPWQYMLVSGGTAKEFYRALHYMTANSVGRATIQKAGAGPFAKNASDPTSTY